MPFLSVYTQFSSVHEHRAYCVIFYQKKEMISLNQIFCIMLYWVINELVWFAESTLFKHFSSKGQPCRFLLTADHEGPNTLLITTTSAGFWCQWYNTSSPRQSIHNIQLLSKEKVYNTVFIFQMYLCWCWLLNWVDTL